MGQTLFIPALIGAYRSIDDDTVTGVVRMRLDQPKRWPKIDRRMLGVVTRSAVKLGGPVTGKLAISEGIETAASAIKLGYGPAWALGNAGAMGSFPVIDGINTLLILGEHCPTNAENAEKCRQRWLKAGRTVQVGLTQNKLHKDLNDELMQVKP